MLFNSIPFLFFLPFVFLLYWFLGKNKLKYQNLFLLMGSYFFYACWDWRFLFLLLFSTLLDYFTALKVEKSNNQDQRKFWFWLSISINLGFLGVFKYYDFFVTSFTAFISNFGFQANPVLINLILPVGISFYTFHGLSYIIDVFNKKITAEKKYIDYALFVSYFPLLVAGPIERATHLLPQIKKRRVFNIEQVTQGLKLILFGFFKKIVVADNCAFFVNQIFENYQELSAAELWIGIVLFAFQIYGDFSGYTDIARGVSKLLGIELLLNFKFPYFAKDIADFWRRWHISLSSWFRDYIYIPLGGSKGSKLIQIRNVFVIFLVSGFWHGANWTFMAWGCIHGALFLPLLLANSNKNNSEYSSFKFYDVFKMGITFLLVCLAWVFFRANSIEIALEYCLKLFDFSNFSIDLLVKSAKHILLFLICISSILVLLIIEFKAYLKNDYDIKFSKAALFLLLLMLCFMGAFKNQLGFIYFQF